MPLRAALEQLRNRGLNLVYSDTLVAAGARIADPPDPALSLDAQALRLLEPFGLGLEWQAPDLWYVVSAPASVPGSGPAGDRQPAADEPTTTPLVEEVVVISSRYRLVRELHEQRRLELQELEAIPSIGRDVLRAVNQLPGMASSGVSARSYIRGGNVDEVLYRIGGAPLIEPFHLGEFQAFFSIFNPDVVGAMNLYSAGFPASLGSRLSGVVDIELKEPEQPLEGSINVSAISAAVHANGRNGPVEWLASARRSTLDQLMRYLEHDYGKPRFNDELLQVQWEGARATATFGALSSNDELSLIDPGAGERARSDFHNLALWARLEVPVGERVEFELLSTFTQVENERSGTLQNEVDAIGRLAESRDFEVISLRPAARIRLTESLTLHTGLEGEHQTGSFEVDLRAVYGILGEPLQPAPELLRNVDSDREGDLFTAFVSLQHALSDRVWLEYGLRHDLQDNDPIHDHQLSPRLQARFRATPKLELYLNAGRYVQHQNLYELQLDDGLLELQAPQVADQLSLGFDWHPDPRLAVRVESYVRDVDDPRRHFENVYNRWVLLPELHADRVALEPARARAYGLEMSANVQRHPAVGWFASYAWARTEERVSGTWRPRPWDQQHSIRLGINWRPANWRIDLMGTWHAGWPTNPRFGGLEVSDGSFYRDRLPDYFSIDLHVARRFEYPKGVLEIYGDLSNATFHENVGGQKFLDSGGAVVARDRELLQPIPAVGISWTW